MGKYVVRLRYKCVIVWKKVPGFCNVLLALKQLEKENAGFAFFAANFIKVFIDVV